MKLVSVIGARPQFVKEAVIQYEINKKNDISEVVIHTGQHYDKNMSGDFFEILKMKTPDYNLGIQSSNHGEMTGQMLIEIEKILKRESPDAVILYGDTNSTLAGALAATKLHITVCHIEAGLRQKPHDMPEEINRILTDHCSDFLFAPCENAVNTLKNEGITNGVYFTGDVMYDIFLKMKNSFKYDVFNDLNLEENNFIVMTLHRDFNVDLKEKLNEILLQINRVSKEIPVIFPIHPRTKKKIREFELEDLSKNIKIIPPVDYLNLMGLTQKCKSVITDSGGYQKESYFSNKNALVIMPDTAWIELVDAKINTLTNPENIYENVMLEKNMNIAQNIYGDGNSAAKCIEIICDKLK